MRPILNCSEVLTNLSCYVDGDGTPDTRKSIEMHAARCRRCRVIADTTRQTLELVRGADVFEIPLSVSARLYERIEAVLSGG
ncbi:MAG: anti-sigma factor family protein [Candidatus Acidiferrales bacterium]